MKIRIPDSTTVVLSDNTIYLNSSLSFEGGFVNYQIHRGLTVRIKSRIHRIRYISLRWNHTLPTECKVLGDDWERGYGHLAWLPMDPDRALPWYMAISNGTDSVRDYASRVTQCFGVGVLPNTLALWNCDAEGVTLTLDLRCGGVAVELGERELECATIYAEEYSGMSAYHAVEAFCGVMSPKPLLADHPIYGSNNWYYAYGNSSHEEIIADTKLVMDLCRNNANPPYMVIDDGWQLNRVDAPWDRGNARFPDMARLAQEIKDLGARPGIWVRFLINGTKGVRQIETFPEECYLSRRNTILDPSHPEVLDYIRQTTKQFLEWGYCLIKHDYSCFDIFGKPGMEFGKFPVNDDETWSFYDRSKTTAEIIKTLYTVIYEASGDAVIIGCNAMGHLCAGIHHCNRIGDDTSGRIWIRTLCMGVNSLAFRGPQNKHFFAADADCVGIMGTIDWKYNGQWLKLLAASGTPLFVSCKPGILNESEMEELQNAFVIGSLQADELIPLDWMENSYPSRYLLNGQEITFDWGPELETLLSASPTTPCPYR